jgi:hypoxanthine phosphoribosyltransferase
VRFAFFHLRKLISILHNISVVTSETVEMADVQKVYITPEQLRVDSMKLGAQVVANGFKPDFLVALWRGGAPIGCFVHELLKWTGLKTDHIAIRTSRYEGIDVVCEGGVEVHSTSYLVENLVPGQKVLLVDDVWDSGTSINAFFKKLESTLSFPISDLDIRVATLYFKPTRNKSAVGPRYYVHETAEWLVFPHELEGMSLDEVELSMGYKVASILKHLAPFTSK